MSDREATVGASEAVVVFSEVDVVASWRQDQARFPDLMQAHHYLSAVPGMVRPSAMAYNAEVLALAGVKFRLDCFHPEGYGKRRPSLAPSLRFRSCHSSVIWALGFLHTQLVDAAVSARLRCKVVPFALPNAPSPCLSIRSTSRTWRPMRAAGAPSLASSVPAIARCPARARSSYEIVADI